MMSSFSSSKRSRLSSTSVTIVSTVYRGDISASPIKKGIVTVTFTGIEDLTIGIDTSALNASTFVFSSDLKECLDTYWPLPCPSPSLLVPPVTKAVPKKYAVHGLLPRDLATASAIAEKLRVPPKVYEDPYLVVHCVEGVSFTRGGYVTSGQDLIAPPLALPKFNGCVYMDDFEEEIEILTVLVAVEKIKPPRGCTPVAIIAPRNCRIEGWLMHIEMCYPTWETRVVRDTKSLIRLMQNLATTDLVVFHVRMFQVRLADTLNHFLRDTIWHTVVFAQVDQLTPVVDDDVCWFDCDEERIFAINPSARQYLLMYEKGTNAIPSSDLDTMLFLLGTFTSCSINPTPVSERRRANSILLKNYTVSTGM
jgi:hypothetical protein